MDSPNQQILVRAVLRLLRPLVRILLRNGIAFGTFSDMAKKVYTDVAFEDFTLEGKKQTVSRVSILTGLTRKEVKRLHELPGPDSVTEEKRYNRAIRVISGWLNDPRFCSDDGVPLPLPIESEEQSFSQLVRLYSGDVPIQAMLTELTNSKSVERRDDIVYLIRHAYVPSDDPVEKMHILGTDVEELIATIDHNLTHQGNELRFQRKVSNENISASSLKTFKQLSAKEAQMFLERLDSWLTEHEQYPDSEHEQTPVKVCMGIYYYEEQSKE
jgi:hypothetical protein